MTPENFARRYFFELSMKTRIEIMLDPSYAGARLMVYSDVPHRDTGALIEVTSVHIFDFAQIQAMEDDALDCVVSDVLIGHARHEVLEQLMCAGVRVFDPHSKAEGFPF